MFCRATEVVKMRTGATLFTVFLLAFTTSPAVAADKIKVEIVEATYKILMVPHTFEGTPEQNTYALRRQRGWQHGKRRLQHNRETRHRPNHWLNA